MSDAATRAASRTNLAARLVVSTLPSVVVPVLIENSVRSRGHDGRAGGLCRHRRPLPIFGRRRTYPFARRPSSMHTRSAAWGRRPGSTCSDRSTTSRLPPPSACKAEKRLLLTGERHRFAVGDAALRHPLAYTREAAQRAAPPASGSSDPGAARALPPASPHSRADARPTRRGYAPPPSVPKRRPTTSATDRYCPSTRSAHLPAFAS